MAHKGPAFLWLFSGDPPSGPKDLPSEWLDLGSKLDLEPLYALFRMYLLDHRVDLALPLLILLDERGMARKIYPEPPPEDVLRADFGSVESG